MKKLTARKIDIEKSPEKGRRKYIPDSEVRNLQVLITDKGTRSFVLYTRLPGKAYASRLALGRGLTLEQARVEARKWLQLIAEGHDPRQIRAREAEKAKEQADNTFGAIVEDYLKTKVYPELARPKFIADTLRNEFVRDVVIDGVKAKGLGPKPIRDVTWQHILTRVKAKRFGDSARGVKPSPTMARHMLAMVKAALNWAKSEDAYGIEENIVADKKVKQFVGEAPSRDRVLSDAELRAVWAAADQVGYPFGHLVKMLLLTAQRRDEVSLARLGEFDWVTVDDERPPEYVWTIPGERMKKRRVHVIPVTDALAAFLGEIPRRTDGDYLFSTTGGDRPFSGFSKAKAKFDSLVEKNLKKELGAKAQIDRWVLHDLRRTVRTRMSRFTSSDTAELVINHQRQGVRKIYDRYDYLDEKREALSKWAAVLFSIIHPKPDNVTKFRKVNEN